MEYGRLWGRSAPIAALNTCETPSKITASTHWTLATSAPAHLLPAAQVVQWRPKARCWCPRAD